MWFEGSGEWGFKGNQSQSITGRAVVLLLSESSCNRAKCIFSKKNFWNAFLVRVRGSIWCFLLNWVQKIRSEYTLIMSKSWFSSCATQLTKYTRAGVTSSPNLSIGHYAGRMKRELWILESNPKNQPEPRASERKIRLATRLVAWEWQRAWKRFIIIVH